MAEVRALLFKMFDHHHSPAQDVLKRRGGEVARLRAVIADLRRRNIQLLGVYAENQRLSAELAAANAKAHSSWKANVQNLAKITHLEESNAHLRKLLEEMESEFTDAVAAAVSARSHDNARAVVEGLRK